MPNPGALLARRWRGIRKAIVTYAVAAGAVAAVWAVTRWERLAAYAIALGVLGVVDATIRTWRTLRLRSIARHPQSVQRVQVTRHYRSRHRIPDLFVAGLWPDGVRHGHEPPLSVRLEDVGALPEGGEVVVYGILRPRRHVLLVHEGRIFWPLRRVAAGLRPRRLGPWPFSDPEDDEHDGDDHDDDG